MILDQYSISEFQFKNISIITTGKHASGFLEKHCDNRLDYCTDDESTMLDILFSNKSDREYIFLVREPLERLLSGLATDWTVWGVHFFRLFNIPLTYENILKSIDKDFIHLTLSIDRDEIKFDSFHSGNWLKFVSYIKINKPIPKLAFINYKDRKSLFKTLGLADHPEIGKSREEFKISYKDLSRRSKNFVDEYLKNEIKYYNYIFKE